MELTPLQRKVLALYKKALAQEQKGLESCAELARFAGNDFGLKVAIQRHQSNITMYKKLIASLQRREC